MLCDMIDGKENLSKFQRIYVKYKNTMYSVAYDILKNSHDAEDIVETSLIKVIDILNNIDDAEIGSSRCKNLMITITKNALFGLFITQSPTLYKLQKLRLVLFHRQTSLHLYISPVFYRQQKYLVSHLQILLF